MQGSRSYVRAWGHGPSWTFKPVTDQGYKIQIKDLPFEHTPWSLFQFFEKEAATLWRYGLAPQQLSISITAAARSGVQQAFVTCATLEVAGILFDCAFNLKQDLAPGERNALYCSIRFIT